MIIALFFIFQLNNYSVQQFTGVGLLHLSHVSLLQVARRNEVNIGYNIEI